MIGLSEIFTLFFITLGPLKVVGPFDQQTASLEPVALRGIAVRVFVLSLALVAIGGYLGVALAIKWKVSEQALFVATAVIFFLVALTLVMEQYAPPQVAQTPLPVKPLIAALKLTFPTVVTPYGIAALIALLAAMQNTVHPAVIWLAVFSNLVLNLIAMLFVRTIMKGPVVLFLRLLGAVLGVLQVALAIQIFLFALRQLSVIAD